MGDEQVRAAERRWRESGTLEDEAAFLHARVRAGELPEARVRWAAACGHEAAARAIEGAPVDLPTLCGELDDPVAETRFWLAVVRATWMTHGDDRYLGRLWADERALLDLPKPSMFELGYATRTSDLLLSIEELLDAARARMRGEAFRPTLPEALRPAPEALAALARHVPSDAVRAVLLADWVPWLLGQGDPVARRVAEQPLPPQVEGLSWDAVSPAQG